LEGEARCIKQREQKLLRDEARMRAGDANKRPVTNPEATGPCVKRRVVAVDERLSRYSFTCPRSRNSDNRNLFRTRNPSPLVLDYE
jgi:hypothetical protein